MFTEVILMKKILMILMVVLMSLSIMMVCLAEDVEVSQPADVLYKLGLLNGFGIFIFKYKT